MSEKITDEDLIEFVRRTEDAADAYMRGDVDRYLDLTHHARGFTLLAPIDGPPTAHEQQGESVRASAGYFQRGEARLEHVQTHAWGDTIVLVMIERQHGVVGGQPDQDCSLRVTLVYRRNNSDWELVHRHADPLVQPLEMEELAALARRARK